MKTKMKLIGILLTLCILIAGSSVLISPAAADSAAPAHRTVATNDGALAARFLNMLNHNYAYGDDFLSADLLLERSFPALLDQCDADNPEYLPAAAAIGFVRDLYGVQIVDLNDWDDGFPKKDGYIHILPCGYTDYTHEIVSVLRNEDGTYTVTTNVTVDAHDGAPEKLTAVSMFAKDTGSAFGYYLVSSRLIEDAANA